MTQLFIVPQQANIPLEDLPWTRCDNQGPVFNEPWEVQAFSLVVGLMEKGYFTRAEWAAALTDAIRDAQQAGDPDTGDTYYFHWVNALEKICLEKGLTNLDEFAVRQADWRQAYLNTPHGKPIELEAAYHAPPWELDDAHAHTHHDHDHDHDHDDHLN